MYLIVYFLYSLFCCLAWSALSSFNSTAVWEGLLGSSLYKWDIRETEMEITELPIDQILGGKKVVGIYFSASWCGPCKQFTPQLAKFYEEMNKKGKKFEIVWVSRDRSVEEFVQYYQSMPWAAVTLENVDKVSQVLGQKYQLKGIPHLVFLDGYDASIYTIDGRTKVLQDKYGLEFPYAPRLLVPRPLRRIINKHKEKIQKQAKRFLEGILESLAPKRLVATARKKLSSIAKQAMDSGLQFIKDKIERARNKLKKPV